MISVHDWATIPFFMMIWLAGLAGIPPELREAAHIDGATPVKTFWHVELPQLRSTAVLVAAISTINAFQTFTLQYVLSTDPGGPPSTPTLVLGLLVLKYGFRVFPHGRCGRGLGGDVRDDPRGDGVPVVVQPPCRVT